MKRTKLSTDQSIINTTKNRFYEKVLLPNENGCMDWIAGISKYGYGVLRINRKTIKAHRYSYELHYGKIPDNMCVLHKCDRPICVAPEHLFLGTQQDNLLDRAKKNRCNMKSGEQHYRSKLTNEQVALIRTARTLRFKSRCLAYAYRVSKATIDKIWGYKIYKVKDNDK